MTDTTVTDADGLPVEHAAELLGGAMPDQAIRDFFAGRVRAPGCPHYMYASERRAGLRTCEHCAH